jgi:RNA polymerase sigma factor (TIGR02999 family)
VDPADLTRLLQAHADGDRGALDAVLPVVYEELKRIARGRLRAERPDHTLDTGALVHEAYVKLARLREMQWRNRSHFFAIAARAMRQVLLDHAIARSAQKRGGGVAHVTLGRIDVGAPPRLDELLAFEEALRRLEEMDERQARVVECRCFGGMSIDETAEALGISAATVSRDWSFACAWLARELTDEPAPGQETES